MHEPGTQVDFLDHIEEPAPRSVFASPWMVGLVALLIGLTIVNVHNFWIAGWPVIITLFGWLAIIGGIIRMAFPAFTKSIGEAMLAKAALGPVDT